MRLEFITTAREGCNEIHSLAQEMRNRLSAETVTTSLGAIPAVGGTSHAVDEIVRHVLVDLGFTPQAKNLFPDQPVALRPDWFRPDEEQGGVILEVERGKTLTNNMDILDFWKCHICPRADHLFLVVPIEIQRTRMVERNVFERVVTRMRTFFEPGYETNVRSVAVFGYG